MVGAIINNVWQGHHQGNQWRRVQLAQALAAVIEAEAAWENRVRDAFQMRENDQQIEARLADLRDLQTAAMVLSGALIQLSVFAPGDLGGDIDALDGNIHKATRYANSPDFADEFWGYVTNANEQTTSLARALKPTLGGTLAPRQRFLFMRQRRD